MSTLPLPRCNLLILLLRNLLARSVSTRQTSCASSESFLQAHEESQGSAGGAPEHIRWSNPLVKAVSTKRPRRRRHLRWASRLVTVIPDKKPPRPLGVHWTEPLIQGISDNLPEHGEDASASFAAKRTRTNKGEHPGAAVASTTKVASAGARDEKAALLAAEDEVRVYGGKTVYPKADEILHFAEGERWDRFAAQEVWAQEYELGNYDWMY